LLLAAFCVTGLVNAPNVMGQQESVDTADVAEIASMDTGDTAWILVSTALVLFMTISGAGVVLRRPRTSQECPVSVDAVPDADGPDISDLAGLWLQRGI